MLMNGENEDRESHEETTDPADRTSLDHNQPTRFCFHSCVETSTASIVVLAIATVPVILALGTINRVGFDLRWQLGGALIAAVASLSIFMKHRISRLTASRLGRVSGDCDAETEPEPSASIPIEPDSSNSASNEIPAENAA